MIKETHERLGYMEANDRVEDQPKTSWLHRLCVAVSPIAAPVSVSVLRLPMSIPRLLVIWIIPIRISLSVGVGIMRIGFVHRSRRPRRLRIVRLLFVRVILIIGVVYVIMICDISVVGVGVSTGDGGGRRREVNLAPRIILVSVVVYGRHRGVILRIARRLVRGVWLIIRWHNRVVDNTALLITVIAVVTSRETAVFQRGEVVEIIVHR